MTTPGCAWRRSDWFNKRLPAWFNMRVLGRGARFRHTDDVLAALVEDLRDRQYDQLLFSGDATAMGFEEEVARAAELLGIGEASLPPGFAVPGNHDYMTKRDEMHGQFERHFSPWQHGERIDGAVYPFARRVGPVWLIGVNSARANLWPWDARGQVGPHQLDRLERLLGQLDDGPRILVTHYPVWVANGARERYVRSLRDLDDLLAVCRRGGVSLWLHGHRHRNYWNPAREDAPFPVICAGSATQSRLWSYKEYTLQGTQLKALTRVYDAESRSFRDGASFELELAGSATARLSRSR